MNGLLNGECVYQVAISGTIIGTRSFENAVTLGKLLESFDRSYPAIGQADSTLECDSIVNIDGPRGQASSARISGNQLIAMGKRISLNKSSREDLEAIPGIGPKLAERIVESKSALGQFSSVDELKRVPGVGPKKFIELSQYLKM